jgi:hypothetical protein
MNPKIIAAILFAGVMTLLAPQPASASWRVSISYFHQELTPYGRWVYTAAYGEVWYPTVVAAGWAPYVDGEWVYTDCGWTWVSYDPFGDPFHYGTWVWVDPYGWCWEPGYVWGPAWVTWAWTDSYIGWAPLPPTFAIAATGYSGGPVTVTQNRYVFVPINQFAGTNVSTVRVATTQNSTILARAQRATRFSVSGGLVHTGGPPTALVERARGKPLRAVRVSSLKLKPTTITAAGIRSGKRVPIVAPAHERSAGLKTSKAGKAGPPKIAHHAAPPAKRPANVAVGRHAENKRTVKEKVPRHVENQRPAPARQAVASRGEAYRTAQRETLERSGWSASNAEPSREGFGRPATAVGGEEARSLPSGRRTRGAPHGDEQGVRAAAPRSIRGTASAGLATASGPAARSGGQ